MGLGHPSSQATNHTINHVHLPLTSKTKLPFCTACSKAKAHSLSHPSSSSIFSDLFDLLFLDVWGPSHILSTNGSRFYLSNVDDHSKYVFLFPFQSRVDISKLFFGFLQFVSNFFSTNILVVQTDSGRKFFPFHCLLQSFGILQRITCPYSHAPNGTIERQCRHIVETSLALLANASMPTKYWVEAFQIAIFLIIHMLTLVLSNRSPFQNLFGTTLDYKFLLFLGVQVSLISIHITNIRLI